MRLMPKLLFALLLTTFALLPLAELSAAPLGVATVSTPISGHSALPDVLAVLAGSAAVGMGIRIKDTGSIAKKFVQRAGVAGGDYADGVKASGGDWEQNAKAAEDNYKQSVTAAANEGRFGKGIAAAGAQKFVERASTLGAQRYPTGVAASESAYTKGVGPHLDMMRGLDLPPRRPKGQNAGRADAVAQANRKLKLSR